MESNDRSRPDEFEQTNDNCFIQSNVFIQNNEAMLRITFVHVDYMCGRESLSLSIEVMIMFPNGTDNIYQLCESQRCMTGLLQHHILTFEMKWSALERRTPT